MATSLRGSQWDRPIDQHVSSNAHLERSPWRQTSTPAFQDQRNGLTSMGGEMERLARALGWFSLGLGFAQIAAPARVARLIGVADDDETIAVMRVLGVREIASGIGILTQPKPAPWLWARVGGDAMDLALLRRAASSPRADHNRVTAATAAVAGIAAVDALCSTRLTAESDAPDPAHAL